MRLFHGSPVENFVPQYGLGNDEHDYGRGFYTTAVPELAREWSVGAQNSDRGWLHVDDVTLNPIVRTFSSLLEERRA